MQIHEEISKRESDFKEQFQRLADENDQLAARLAEQIDRNTDEIDRLSACTNPTHAVQSAGNVRLP